MSEGSGGWLVVLAEAEAIRWVLKNGRMAFSKGLCSRARQIQEGDRIVLYAARGAYHNPTRDRSQIIGIARATGPVRAFPRPVTVTGRDFVCGMGLEILNSLPERQGIPVEPFVRRLKFIKRPEVWGQYLRAGLVRLGERDFALLASAVDNRREEG